MDPAVRHLTLVCSPPGAGKSTFCLKHPSWCYDADLLPSVRATYHKLKTMLGPRWYLKPESKAAKAQLFKDAFNEDLAMLPTGSFCFSAENTLLDYTAPDTVIRRVVVLPLESVLLRNQEARQAEGKRSYFYTDPAEVNRVLTKYHAIARSYGAPILQDMESLLDQ